MVKINDQYSEEAQIVLYQGHCLDLLRQIPDGAVKLVVTSPPYNIGKPYEDILPLKEYLARQEKVVAECARILHANGSLCWQVGYYSEKGEIFPLDIVLYNFFKRQGLKLKNRIIWHFRGGQHVCCFSWNWRIGPLDLVERQAEEKAMPKHRKNYTAQQKVAILRRHLVEKVPVSDLCEEYQLQPTVFYRWQKDLFEKGALVFERPSSARPSAEGRRLASLEAKLRRKNDVLAELMEEHVVLKKSLGEL